MAAANESQGLKIAVAAFIALTVILTVTSYFLYSAYSTAEARLQSANEQCRDKSKTANLALTQLRRNAKQDRHQGQEADAAPRKRSTPISRRSTSGSAS